jgi:hypothetical protein
MRFGIEEHAIVQFDSSAIRPRKSRNTSQKHRLSGTGCAQNAQRLGLGAKGDIESEVKQLFLDLNFE